VYVNTSIVLRALNPEELGHHEARRLLEECCKRCNCVYSSVHAHEMPAARYQELRSFLDSLGAERKDPPVGVVELRRQAEEW